jgi:hypothetical protein
MSIFSGNSQANLQPGVVTNGAIVLLDASQYTTGSATWTDLSGNGNNFTLNSMVANYQTPLGGYWQFPSANRTSGTSFFSLAHNATLNIFNGDYTIEFWGTVDATGTAAGSADNQGLVSKQFWPDNPGIGQLINTETGGANLGLQTAYINGTGYNTLGTFGKAWDYGFTLGAWVCVQQVRQAGVITGYGNTWRNFSAATVLNGNNSSAMRIGSPRNVSPYYGWGGKLMFVAIYGRALSAQERSQNFNVFAQRTGYNAR